MARLVLHRPRIPAGRRLQWRRNTESEYYDWPRVSYLDIWHRMALGWIEPEIYDIRIGKEDHRTASLGWGKFNQPFLESISASVMWPGSASARVQLQAGGHIMPLLVLHSLETNRDYPLFDFAWDATGCSVEIPPEVPGGRYLLQSQVSENGTIRVSNSLPLTVSDPYDLWAYFNVQASGKRRPSDDPDGDGWDNFAEYAMAKNPNLPGDPGARVSYGIEHVPPSGERRFFMRWPMAGNRAIVGFQLESSWDLKTWQAVDQLMSIPDPDPAFNWLKGVITPGPAHDRGFLRLGFTKLNEP